MKCYKHFFIWSLFVIGFWSCSDDEFITLVQVGEWNVVSIVTTSEETSTDTIEIAKDTTLFELALNKDGTGTIRDSLLEKRILDWNIDDNQDSTIYVEVELVNSVITNSYSILVNETDDQVWGAWAVFRTTPSGVTKRTKEIWEMSRVK